MNLNVMSHHDAPSVRASYAGLGSDIHLYETYSSNDAVPFGSNELMICRMISGRKLVAEKDSTPVTIYPGNVFSVTPYKQISALCPDSSQTTPSSCLAIEISSKAIQFAANHIERFPLLLGSYKAECNRLIGLTCSAQINEIFSKILHLLRSCDPDKDVLIDLSVKELIIRIARHESAAVLFGDFDGIFNSLGSDSLGKNRFFYDAFRYIQANLHNHLDINELAKKVCMSKSKLYVEFKRHFECTPSELHLHLRLRHAERRIREGAPFTEISYELGFSCPSHFTHRFKEAFGKSPSAYRNGLSI